jgi:hypothetical protein
MSQAQLHGSVLVLILFDVCEEIRLEEFRRILGLQPVIDLIFLFRGKG